MGSRGPMFGEMENEECGDPELCGSDSIALQVTGCDCEQWQQWAQDEEDLPVSGVVLDLQIQVPPLRSKTREK